MVRLMDRYTRPDLFLKSEKSGFKAARLSLIMENLPPWSRNCMKSNAIVFCAAWALSACIQWRAKALISYALIATGGPIHLLPPPLTGGQELQAVLLRPSSDICSLFERIFLSKLSLRFHDCQLNIENNNKLFLFLYDTPEITLPRWWRWWRWF